MWAVVPTANPRLTPPSHAPWGALVATEIVHGPGTLGADHLEYIRAAMVFRGGERARRAEAVGRTRVVSP